MIRFTFLLAGWVLGCAYIENKYHDQFAALQSEQVVRTTKADAARPSLGSPMSDDGRAVSVKPPEHQ